MVFMGASTLHGYGNKMKPAVHGGNETAGGPEHGQRRAACQLICFATPNHGLKKQV
jgi:hypothetical protein